MKKGLLLLFALLFGLQTMFNYGHAEEVLVTSGEDLKSAVESATAGDTLILESGGTYTAGEITVPVSMVIKAEEGAMVKPVVQTAGLIFDGVQDLHLQLSGIEFDGESANDYFIRYASASSVETLAFHTVDVYGYNRCAVRADVDGSSMGSLLIEDSYFYDFSGGGYRLFYFRDDLCPVDTFAAENSTFDGFNESFLQANSSALKTVLINNCTINGKVGDDSNPVFNVDGEAGSSFKITNSVISNMAGNTVFSIGENVSDTIVNSVFYFDETVADTSNIWSHKEEFNKTDPAFSDEENGNFTITNEELLNASLSGRAIGDLNWVAAPASIETSEGSITPEFDPVQKAYQINLPSGTGSVELSANPITLGGSVSVPDELSLSDGVDEMLSIDVTSARGDNSETYDVYIHVQTEDEILYLSAGNTGVFEEAIDQDKQIVNMLKDQGYSVTYLYKYGIEPFFNDFEQFDYSPYKAMVISPSAPSNGTVAFAADSYPIPCVSMQKDGPKENKFGWTTETEESSTEEADKKKMKVVDNSHYITSAFDLDEELVWTTFEEEGVVLPGYDLSNDIPEAQPLTIYNGASENFYNGYAIPEGTAIADTAFQGRFVILAAHTEAMLNPTEDMFTLVSRSLEWALEKDAPNLESLTPSEGSLEPEFETERYNYQMTLPAGTTTLDFSATPTNAGAEVSIPSDISLSDGTDTNIEIEVEAEGEVNVYNVNVHVQDEEEILYLSAGNNGVFEEALDQDKQIVEMLRDQGYSVTYLYKYGIEPFFNDFDEFDYSPYTAMVISPSVPSNGTVAFARDGYPLPCFSMQKDGPKDNKFGWTTQTEESSTVEAEKKKMKVANNNHYITGIFDADEELEWTTFEEEGVVLPGYDLANDIPEAEPLTIYSGASENFFNGYAIPAGTTIGESTLENRFALMAVHTEAMLEPTETMFTLISRSVEWIMEEDLAPNLMSLKPSAGTLDPEFESERNAYQVTVPAGTSSLDLDAVPTNAEAQVTVPEDISLSDGLDEQYQIEVQVGEETNVYDVYVHVQAEEEILYLSAGNNGVLEEGLVQDQQIVQLLKDEGYSVTYIYKYGIEPFFNDFEQFDYSPYSAIVISPSVPSNGTEAFARDGYPLPCFSMQKDGPKDNKFGWTDQTEESSTVEAKKKKMKVVNNNHYITEIFEADEELEWTTFEEEGVVLPGYDLSDDIPEAIALTKYNGASENFFNSYVIVPGTTIGENTLDHRFALIATHTEAMINPTSTMNTLITRSLHWVLNPETTDIENESAENNSSVIVYPTVSNGEFTVELENPSGEISVFDLSGKMVLTKEVESETEAIQISKAGMYIINVSNGKQQELVKVIVK